MEVLEVFVRMSYTFAAVVLWGLFGRVLVGSLWSGDMGVVHSPEWGSLVPVSSTSPVVGCSTVAFFLVNQDLYPASQSWPMDTNNLYFRSSKWCASLASLGNLLCLRRAPSFDCMTAPVGVPHIAVVLSVVLLLEGASVCRVWREAPVSSTPSCEWLTDCNGVSLFNVVSA